MLSKSNVRRIKAGVSVVELAEDIALRSFVQSLSARPVLDDDGTETGKAEVSVGGRRLEASTLLVTLKRLAKTTPIPCIVRDAGPRSRLGRRRFPCGELTPRRPVAARPIPRVSMRDKGPSDAEIAAAFSAHHFRMALEVSSVLLSDTIMPGLPRRSFSAVSSRATPRPEVEVSGIAARYSLVMSLTTLSFAHWPVPQSGSEPLCRRPSGCFAFTHG